jgi:hypothetical protein
VDILEKEGKINTIKDVYYILKNDVNSCVMLAFFKKHRMCKSFEHLSYDDIEATQHGENILGELKLYEREEDVGKDDYAVRIYNQTLSIVVSLYPIKPVKKQVTLEMSIYDILNNICKNLTSEQEVGGL